MTNIIRHFFCIPVIVAIIQVPVFTYLLCLCICLCLVEGEVCDVEQTLGSLAMEAVTLLVTGNNSNAGQ